MREIDVLTNLKNHDYSFQHYPMNKAEAEVCVAALKEKIAHQKEIDEAKKALWGGKDE